LELASLSPEMREQLRHDILAVKHEIQVAEESQAKLEKWEVENLDKRLECLLCFSDVDLSNSSNLWISSLRLTNGFFNTPLWLFHQRRSNR
jgi:hypothetical protein